MKQSLTSNIETGEVELWLQSRVSKLLLHHINETINEQQTYLLNGGTLKQTSDETALVTTQTVSRLSVLRDILTFINEMGRET